VTQLLLRGRLAEQLTKPWLSIVPIAERNSSYNGLMLILFALVSAGLRPPRASVRLAPIRRAGAWDCGYPGSARPRNTAAPATRSRSAACSARSHSVRENRGDPQPGDMRPARIRKHRTIWRGSIYAPIGLRWLPSPTG